MTRRKFLISKDQRELPFRAKNGGFLAAASAFEHRFLASVAGCLVISSVLYVYFVMTSVTYVAAREAMSHEATVLSAEVSSLEARYLARAQGITEPYARTHGFVSASSRGFVERASLVSLDSR